MKIRSGFAIGLCLFLVFCAGIRGVAQPQQNDERLQPVRELLEQGDADGALTALDRFLEEHPVHEEALSMRIIVTAYSQEDIVKRILVDLEILNAVSQNPLPIYEAAAGVLIQRKKDREARRLVDSAIPKFPDSETLMLMRGNLKVFEADYEGAIADFNHILARSPDNVEALNSLSRAFFMNLQIVKAIETGERLLEIDSDSERSVRLRKDLLEGGLWEAEDLQQFLLSHGMRFIVEEMDEYLFLYVDEQAHADHDWIRVTIHESMQAAENAMNQMNEYIDEADAEDLDDDSFFWGRFIFTKGCGLNEHCSATWDMIRRLLTY